MTTENENKCFWVKMFMKSLVSAALFACLFVCLQFTLIFKGNYKMCFKYILSVRSSVCAVVYDHVTKPFFGCETSLDTD